MALHTRSKILEAFLELANRYPEKEHFTFTEIAKEAGVSRQAIYKRHFNSVGEIVLYIRQKAVAVLTDSSLLSDADSNPFIFIAQTALPSLYQQRRWIRTLYISAVDPHWRTFLIETCQDFMIRHMGIRHQKLGLSREGAARIFAEWLCSLIENWLIQEEPLPPEEFSRIFLQLISTPLTALTDYGSQMPSLNKLVIPQPRNSDYRKNRQE